ncbi:hypothetical protein ACTHQ6_00715 [Arthrobacter sp. SAFR-179]|uniref:hypothetical protein n=1 Tax=Arthrobacter sp. SAFR-179 TaxID=3387279 RepID=UPI003F7C7292
MDELLEFVLRGRGAVRGAGAQEDPELFLDLPDGLQGPGPIVKGEYVLQAGRPGS